MSKKDINIGCCSDKTNGLKYKDLSIVFMQIFTLDQALKKEIKILEKDKNFVHKDTYQIDKQIFIYREKNLEQVKRFIFKGTEFSITLKEPELVNINGTIRVEMSLLFDKIVSISYRIVINRDEKKGEPMLSADHIIGLVSFVQNGENWKSYEENLCADYKNGELNKISELYLNATGNWNNNVEILTADNVPENTEPIPNKIFAELFRRYKKYVMRLCGNKKNIANTKIDTDTIYSCIDIWESVQDSDDNRFLEFIEKERLGAPKKIMEHIMNEHKSELNGLMSLYPEDWAYRTNESYKDVCGDNIANDTSDLILVNQKICVVLGVYALDVSKLDLAALGIEMTEHEKEFINISKKWVENAKAVRERCGISWSGYFMLLEMALAQKHAINQERDKLLEYIRSTKDFNNPTKDIKDLAKRKLETTNLMVKLDAVKYCKFVSYKIMFNKTRKRLGIEEDTKKLEEVIDKLNNHLDIESRFKQRNQDISLNIVLSGLMLASLVTIVFHKEEENDFLSHLTGIIKYHETQSILNVGDYIIGITIGLIILIIILFMTLWLIKNLKCLIYFIKHKLK